jgi:hypothetical protein
LAEKVVIRYHFCLLFLCGVAQELELESVEHFGAAIKECNAISIDGIRRHTHNFIHCAGFLTPSNAGTNRPHAIADLKTSLSGRGGFIHNSTLTSLAKSLEEACVRY